MKNKFFLFVFSILTFLLLQQQAQANCYEWVKEDLDQYVGKCTNQNYERLPLEGGPLPLHCTNWTYPLYWNCHNIFKKDGNSGTDLSLEKAANLACGCE